MEIILIKVLLIWNAVAFLLMGWDKYRARTHGWRVPEKTLFLVAFAMGGPGIFLGMQVFRHKTKHTAFRIGVPVAIVINMGIILLLRLQ